MKYIKSKIPPHVKRYLNSIRYETLPTLKMGLKRLINYPQIPKNSDGKVLIHLGCGPQNDERYINVDLIPFPHVHFIHGVTRLPMFKNNYADLLYASHVLEHTQYGQLKEILKEWCRVIKPGGIIRIAVPDFDKILEIYELENHNIEKIEGVLMGAQHYRYNFHMAVFNKDYLTKLLIESGFTNIRTWDPKTAPLYSFTDWASKLLFNKYHISLNLEAIKE